MERIAEVVLTLLALGDPSGVENGQAGFFKTGLGAGDVVGNAAVKQEVLLVIVEHVAGAGVVVAGLSDAADIHRIAFFLIEADRCFSGLQASAGGGFWI